MNIPLAPFKQCFVFGSWCGLAETNKKEKQLQFLYHYGEVRGLSNFLIFQGLIGIKKEEKEVLPKISKHLSWVKEIEKITNEYQ